VGQWDSGTVGQWDSGTVGQWDMSPCLRVFTPPNQNARAGSGPGGRIYPAAMVVYGTMAVNPVSFTFGTADTPVCRHGRIQSSGPACRALECRRLPSYRFHVP